MKKLFLLLGLLFALCGAAFAAVNLNTATREELEALKGIGPVKAQAIIDHRTKNGPFKSVDDLQNVKGIGPKTVEDLRNELSVRGTTASAKPAATSSGAAKATEVPKSAKAAPRAAATTTKAEEKNEAAKAKSRQPKAEPKAAGG